MRKTKSEGKTVGIFAISSQTVRNVLRISQCEKSQRISQCEISQCENHIAFFAMRNTTLRISQCEKPLRISQCENHIALRIWLRIWLQIWQCEFSQCEVGKPHFAMPNGCQLIAKIPVLFFFFSLLIFNICSKICTKLLKLMQEKLHKGTN